MTSFLQDRVIKIQNQIIAYEDAITALVSGGVQEYSLDSGQTKQKVTRLDVKSMQDALDTLYNRLTTLQARLSGSGSVTGRPSW